jgi:hypothetical protein
MTVDERRRDWDRCLADQVASGWPARAWCRQAEVAYGTFSHWRRRRGGEAAFAPVTLIPVVDEAPAPVGLRVVVGGARIEVEPEFDADLLRRVVAALSPC